MDTLAVANLNTGTGTIRAIVDWALAGESHELTGPRVYRANKVQRTLNVRVCVCISIFRTEFEEFNKKSSCDAAGFAKYLLIKYFDPGLIRLLFASTKY